MSEGDTVSVTIGADAAGVRSGTDAAKAAISGMSASGRADAAALNVEFQKLNATLAAMQVQVRQTSEAATGLKSYADWGAALGLIVLGYEGVAGAAALAAKSADFVKGAVVGAEQGAKSAGLQWIAYAESLAYVDQNHLHVRQSGEGMTAAYGRMSIAVKEWLQEFNLFGGATVRGELNALALSGALEKLNKQLDAIGIPTASAALSEFTTTLMRIPGMTEAMAAQIQNSFARIPGYSAPLNQELVDLVGLFSDSASEAQTWGAQLAAVMSDPLNIGKQFLDTLGGVDAGIYAQLTTAREGSDVYAAQALILKTVAERARSIVEAQKQGVVDNEKWWAQWGAIGRLAGDLFGSMSKNTEKTNDLWRETNRVVGELKGATNAIREQVPAWDEVHKKILEIIAAEGSASSSVDVVSAKIATLNQGLLTSTGSAEKLIQSFEKGKTLRTSAYWDENKDDPAKSHWAIGLGQHSLNGVEVTKKTTATEAEIYQDFKNRIADIQNQLAEKIGASWAGISERAKASMASMVYNYGIHSPALNPMFAAAQAGDEGRIAAAISARAGDDGGQNQIRRQREATNITGGGALSPDEQGRASQVLDKLLDQQQKLTDAKAGGNAVDRANLDTLERQLQGDRDVVAAAERKVTAAQQDLVNAHGAEQVAARKLALTQAQNDLDEKSFAAKKAQAAYDVASADPDKPQEVLDAKKKQAQLVMDRYRSAPQSPEYLGAQQQSDAAQTEFDKSKTASAAADEDSRYKIELKGLEQRKEVIAEERDLRKISASEALAQDLLADDQRVAVEKAHLEKLKAIYGEESSEYAKAQRKMSETLASEAVRRQRDEVAAAKQSQQAWDAMASSLSGTMASTITGLITHTEKFRDAERKVATDILGSFVKMGTDWVASFAMAVLKNVATQVQCETMMTAATTAGVAARSGAQAAGAASGMAAQAATIMKSIMASAAEAGAGVTGFLAPVMGPAAIGAGAAMEGSVIGMAGAVAKMDVGAWNIPHDQLAVVHKNEMVMTAGQSEGLRNLIQNGGAGGGPSAPSVSASAHVSISAMDSRSIKRTLDSNGGVLMKTMSRAVRNGAHLGLAGISSR